MHTKSFLIEYSDSHMRAHNKCPQWTRRVSDTRISCVGVVVGGFAAAAAFIFRSRVRDCKRPVRPYSISYSSTGESITKPCNGTCSIFVAFTPPTGSSLLGMVPHCFLEGRMCSLFIHKQVHLLQNRNVNQTLSKFSLVFYSISLVVNSNNYNHINNYNEKTFTILLKLLLFPEILKS